MILALIAVPLMLIIQRPNEHNIQTNVRMSGPVTVRPYHHQLYFYLFLLNFSPQKLHYFLLLLIGYNFTLT